MEKVALIRRKLRLRYQVMEIRVVFIEIFAITS
jgi:hypothetical protein